MSNNVIYLTILSHGLYEYDTRPYKNDDNQEKIYAKTKYVTPFKQRLFRHPNVIIPESIEYIQKITYTPFGLYNILSPNDTEHIYKRISTILNDDMILGEPFSELVKNEVTFETIESKLARPENPEYIVEDLKLLLKNRDNICQEYLYVKTAADNKPLLNKTFSMTSAEDDEDDEDEYTEAKCGIYVMVQKGGTLNAGDNILADVGTLTTQELLETVSRHGYTTVVIMDYSCDVCTTMFGMKPDDKHMEHMKTQILEGKIGRGGKAKKPTHTRKRKTKKRKTCTKIKNHV